MAESLSDQELRQLPRRELRELAYRAALRALPCYERARPGDGRVREALQLLQTLHGAWWRPVSAIPPERVGAALGLINEAADDLVPPQAPVPPARRRALRAAKAARHTASALLHADPEFILRDAALALANAILAQRSRDVGAEIAAQRADYVSLRGAP